MISCRAGGSAVVPFGSLTASSSASRSPKCCSTVPTSGASCLAKRRLGHLFPYIPGQSGFNKRLRALAPRLLEAIALLARLSPSFCDRLRLLASTPVPCAASRETVRRSQLAGAASYGYCRSHHRYFWGFRLYLLCAPDGMPIGFELAPANAPERVVAAELLERALEPGQTLVCDKGFAGRKFEQLVVSLRARILRPDRRNEPARFGSLGGVRQWVESAFDTLKDQLSLERHGGRTLAGLVSRVARRLLALAAAIPAQLGRSASPDGASKESIV